MEANKENSQNFTHGAELNTSEENAYGRGVLPNTSNSTKAPRSLKRTTNNSAVHIKDKKSKFGENQPESENSGGKLAEDNTMVGSQFSQDNESKDGGSQNATNSTVPEKEKKDDTIYCESLGFKDSKGENITSNHNLRAHDIKKVMAVDTRKDDKQYWSDTIILFRLNETLRRNPKMLNRVSIIDPLVFEQTLKKYNLWRHAQFGTEELKKLSINFAYTRKLQIFEKEIIVIPLCQQGHWMAAIVVNHRSLVAHQNERLRKHAYVYLFDSMETNEAMRLSRDRNFRAVIAAFLSDQFAKYKLEYLQKKEKDDGCGLLKIHPQNLVLQEPEGLPKQKNKYDCGPYVAHFLDHALDEKRGIVSEEKFLKGQMRWTDISSPYSDIHIQYERQLTKHIILDKAPKHLHPKIESIIETSLLMDQKKTPPPLNI